MFQPDSFLRNLALLGSGTALAQFIPILASPILTRLYSPNDFGMLAVFMAMLATFTPIICGKYEVAQVLPKSRAQSEHLFGIALYFTLGLSGLLAVIFLFFSSDILLFLNADKLGHWIFSVPIALLLTGFFNASSYLANRNKQYNLLSKAKISRSLTTASVSIFAGTSGFGFGGLLAGLLSGFFTASLLLLYQNRTILNQRVFSWGRAKRMILYKYRNFPIYNATTGLLDGLTLSLPVFFLSRYFPDSTAGYYAIVIRITLAPVSFISASVSQINLKKVVDLVNAGRPVVPYLLKLAGLLLLIMLVPSLIIIFFGPDLFAFVFGENWAIAGEYARILMPAIVIQFVSSTLSSTLEVTQHNQLLAVWRLMFFSSTAIVLCIFAPKGKIETFFWAITINNIIIYILYFGFILYAAYNPKKFS